MRSRPTVLFLGQSWVMMMSGLTAVAALAAHYVGTTVGAPAIDIMIGYASVITMFAPATLVILAAIGLLHAAINREPEPARKAKAFLVQRLGSAGSAGEAIIPLLLLPFVLAAYGTVKQVMPLLRPFEWDAVLTNADRMIFGGVQPWTLTHEVFGSELATFFLDRTYGAWFLLMYLASLLIALFAPSALRARYFISFLFAWLLLGVVCAYLFSSAGPCFPTDAGTVSSEFAPLLDRLRAIDGAGYDLKAVGWQMTLWDAHIAQRYGFAMGISAMPSMHNAIAFLFVLAAREAGMKWMIPCLLFAIAILIGSVHLGWHYFTDGVFSWLGMSVIWWSVGMMLTTRSHPSSTQLKSTEPAPLLV